MKDQTKIDISYHPLDATDFGQLYFLALTFPTQVADSLEDVAMGIAREINGVMVQPAASLHISVLDFIDAFIDPAHHGYPNKDAFWQKIGDTCEAAIQNALIGIKPFDIRFGELVVTDSAIILKGEDDGQLQRIRESILHDIDAIRLPRSKRPPVIIHSSIARYTKEMSLEPIREAAAGQMVNFILHVDTFHLIHQLKMNMLESQELKAYHLM
jgi:2'-5' RNA ligase